MNLTEILIIAVNIAILILPLVMLIENLIKRNYKILNVCMLINIFIWIYLSYVWNIRNPGFWIKCDARILNLIASVILIASIITFILQIKHKKGNKLLIMIAIIFVFYIIMTNDTTYEERTRVDMVSDKTIREFVLEEHIPYIAFLSIELELFVNLSTILLSALLPPVNETSELCEFVILSTFLFREENVTAFCSFSKLRFCNLFILFTCPKLRVISSLV